MAFTVTPTRRRLAMAALLALAVSGLVLRTFAATPSTLRDVGTLLLVLWLPAVGNVIAYLLRKIPYRTPPATDFAAGAAFTPHLQASVEVVAVDAQSLATLAPADSRCILVTGRRAFTARVAQPVAQAFGLAGEQPMAFELLHPAAALPHLGGGTEFHVLVGSTGVGKARVAPGGSPGFPGE